MPTDPTALAAQWSGLTICMVIRRYAALCPGAWADNRSRRERRLNAAREHVSPLLISELKPAQPELFRSNTHWPYFDRLRKQDPVSYVKDSMYGPYRSETKYNDIMDVETTRCFLRQPCSAAASFASARI